MPVTYKQLIKEHCEEYAKRDDVRFLGYNTAFGSRMYGTLSDIPASQCVETPVAENLMVGLSIGLALKGYRPVLCFERHDFMLLALDGLVNHMDKLPALSGGQFKLPIIIRAIVGSHAPIDPGVMHRQSYTLALSNILKNTPVLVPYSRAEFKEAWDLVGKTRSGAVVIVELKDNYEEPIS